MIRSSFSHPQSFVNLCSTHGITFLFLSLSCLYSIFSILWMSIFFSVQDCFYLFALCSLWLASGAEAFILCQASTYPPGIVWLQITIVTMTYTEQTSKKTVSYKCTKQWFGFLIASTTLHTGCWFKNHRTLQLQYLMFGPVELLTWQRFSLRHQWRYTQQRNVTDLPLVLLKLQGKLSKPLSPQVKPGKWRSSAGRCVT